MKRLFWLLLAYCQARRLRFADRAALRAHRMRQLQKVHAHALPSQRLFRALPAACPWTNSRPWTEAAMLANFNAMNTAGLALEDVMADGAGRRTQPGLHAHRRGHHRRPVIGYLVPARGLRGQ